MNKDTKQAGYVYLLTNKGNSVLYVGATANLTKRCYQHKQEYLPGFARRYHLSKLVYYEVFDKTDDALIREKTIKGWLRKKKIALVESKNPNWKDLYNELEGDPSLANARSGCPLLNIKNSPRGQLK